MTPLRPLAALVVFVLAGLVMAPVSSARAQEPLVAAASDLQFALVELAEAFEADTGLSVRLVTGSSGSFARQIRQGAPFELFLSADEAYVLDLARDGHLRDEGVLYAIGRLALLVPDGSPIPLDGPEGLATALAEGRVRRFAIANPEHAPYGARAEEWLRHHGLWEAIQPRLVFGENVSQAAQFALSGSAEGGIVAWSLLRSPVLSSRGRHRLLDETGHAPLRQRMALTRRAGPAAERFYHWLQSPAARDILARHGFELPAPAEGAMPAEPAEPPHPTPPAGAVAPSPAAG